MSLKLNINVKMSAAEKMRFNFMILYFKVCKSFNDFLLARPFSDPASFNRLKDRFGEI
jgi:hypothetical protein